MVYREKIYVPEERLKWLEEILTKEPADENEFNDRYFGEDETYKVSVSFPDFFSMDIMVCGVQYEEGTSNTCFSQAVLYNEDGGEVTYTDTAEEFGGTWTLEADDVTYEVTVLPRKGARA